MLLPWHHNQPLPQPLADTVRRLMQNTNVKKVTILDDEGIVLFSTQGGLGGINLRETPGFKSAHAGAVHSKVGEPGDISLFFLDGIEETLIGSYIPIRSRNSSPVSGVFAVETGVRPLMAEIERSGTRLFFGSMGIMGLLYLALLYIVRYAERIIQGQESRLSERSRALELLSSQLITVQEDEKKRLAHELHEGVVQTLSSIKFQVEHAGRLVRRQETDGEEALEQVVPVVQALIKEVRSLAIEMRPPSLDELGALATLQWYCHELNAVYPQLEMHQEFSIEEEEIPKPIKVVLYRAVRQRLLYLARTDAAMTVRVVVGKARGAVCLEVTDNRALRGSDAARREVERQELVTLREFLTLSGAEVDIREPDAEGGSTIFADWPV